MLMKLTLGLNMFLPRKIFLEPNDAVVCECCGSQLNSVQNCQLQDFKKAFRYYYNCKTSLRDCYKYKKALKDSHNCKKWLRGFYNCKKALRNYYLTQVCEKCVYFENAQA